MSAKRFFVNRGGGRAPEGPFEEDQIIRLILAGKLSAGYICQEGKQRFVVLDSHLPFAHALERAGVPATPNTLAARKKAEAAAAHPVQTRPSERRGLLLAALLAFFGLALAAVAIGTYVMFSNGGMPVHAAVPNDTELLFEVVSLRDTVRDLGWVRALDTKQLAESRLLDAAANDLSSSFGVTKSRANTLLLAASSIGVAARKLTSMPEGGVLLTFTSATPVNALFATKHFSYTGLVSSNGRKYKLSADVPAGPGGASLRALAGLQLDTARSVLVWFETSKVLFVGSPSFGEDVARALSLDSPSLALNPSFQKAQHDFTDKADAVAYFDVAQLVSIGDWRLNALYGSRKAKPAAVSLKLVPAGVVAHVVQRSSNPVPGSGPAAPLLAPAQPLRVMDRLPSETFAYIAGVTKTRLSGPELRQALLHFMANSSPAAAERATIALQQLEQQLHLSFDQVLGSVGDQAALGLLAPADYAISLGGASEMASHFAAVYVQALKDEAPARALLAQLAAQLGSVTDQVQAHAEVDGLSLLPSDARLGVSGQIRIFKGYLCVALGSPALVERGLHAVSTGEGTLANEPAQRAARGALPVAAQALAWLDAGRVVSTVLQNPLLSARVQDLGLDRGGIHWTGPDRVTVALAFSEEYQNGVYTDRVDALNLPAFAGILLTGP
jgi:hypothetical protein